MSSIKSIVVVAAALLGLLLAGGAQANMITNGSFETNTGTDAYYWATGSGTDSSVTFGSAAGWDVAPAPDGTQVAKLTGNTYSAYIVDFAMDLMSGTTYTYSFYVKSELNDGQNRGLILLQNRSVGGGDAYCQFNYMASTTWQQYSFTFTPTANGQARVEAYTMGGTISSLYVDDFQLNAVIPEPTTAMLLGALGTALLFRRRRGHG